MCKYKVDLWEGAYGQSRLLNMPDVRMTDHNWPDLRYFLGRRVADFFEFVDKTQEESYKAEGVVPAYFNYKAWDEAN